MSNEVARVVTLSEMERMAASMAKSGLFGVKDQDQALALMLVAQAENKHPATVARDFDIIQGRAAKKSEAMLRDLIQSGGSVQWHQLDDTGAEATFSHPQGGSVKIRWDMARATQAGLAGKDMYKKYPRQMLRSRTVSEGCRTVAPFVTSGMYTPEEAADIEIDITPPRTPGAVEAAVTQAAADTATALTAPEIESHVDAMNEATTLEALQAAYMAGHAHAKAANDRPASKRFTAVYELRSADIKAAGSKAGGK